MFIYIAMTRKDPNVIFSFTVTDMFLLAIFSSQLWNKSEKLWRIPRICEHGNIRKHKTEFFEVVNKPNETKIEINNTLLSMTLLYNLLSSFESFKCEIKKCDNLLYVEFLRIKIIEECNYTYNPIPHKEHVCEKF